MATLSAVKGTMSLRFGHSAAVDLNMVKLTKKNIFKRIKKIKNNNNLCPMVTV